MTGEPTVLPLGLGGDTVQPVGLDPASRVHLVAGHRGSGRSTALVVLGRAAARAGRRVVAVTPGHSPLSSLDGGDLHVVPGVGAAAASALQRLLAAGPGAGQAPLLLVDDVEGLDGTPVGDLLVRLVADSTDTSDEADEADGDRRGAGAPTVVAAGCTPDLLSRFHGLCVDLRRPGTGLVLGPAGPADGDVLGVRLPRREVRLPGRGVLVHRGTSTMVQVAHPGPARAPGPDGIQESA